MQKTIEVKPKFLLVSTDDGVEKERDRAYPNYRLGTTVLEFEEEKDLRATALKQAENGFTVKAYKVSSIAKATSYAALNMKWR